MQTRYLSLLLTLGTSLFLSCEEPEEAITPDATTVSADGISEEVKEQLARLNFDVSDLTKVGEDYLVEGDMLISPESLANMVSSAATEGPQGEQYRASTLVDRGMRTIRIRTSDNGVRFSRAVNRAINNFNALGLTFTMVRVPFNESADITVWRSEEFDRWGVAQYPKSRLIFPVRPGGYVKLAASLFDQDDNFIEHVVTHELGHTVGLRHTDWYDRSLSCGGTPRKDTGGSFIRIPGTPKYDPSSVMRSCTNGNLDGEFSFNDRQALREIY